LVSSDQLSGSRWSSEESSSSKSKSRKLNDRLNSVLGEVVLSQFVKHANDAKYGFVECGVFRRYIYWRGTI
jgi:hypothetical protein